MRQGLDDGGFFFCPGERAMAVIHTMYFVRQYEAVEPIVPTVPMSLGTELCYCLL